MHPPTLGIRDALLAQLDAQRAAFARGAPDYAARIRALETLRDALRAREDDLVRAVSEDFGGRAYDETRVLEIFPVHDAIRHARKHLRKWMRRRRVGTTWFLRPSRSYVLYQPLGVVGIIGAWNYQLYLALSPLVDAIAAGNHVMLKPSEITPRTAEVIQAMIAEAFPPEYVTVVTGGAEVAGAFSGLPFDHLLFTGSTRVGHLVMRAASENLTPVTLELGGKSPAIIHESFPLDSAISRILAGKLYNAGQTCVAPDYVLLPAGREAEVERLAREVIAKRYPTLVDNPDYTRIISDAHLDRLNRALAEAAARGARVVPIDPAGELGSGAPAAGDRLIPPTLVFDAAADSTLMCEEIFGPILPVVAYRTLDEAIEYVNARPRPLALYYFDHDDARIRRVLERTISGGVTINDVLIHLGESNLPFGGVGASGMGHYHGFDGFETFSKKKGVLHRRAFSMTDYLSPPFTEAMRKRIQRAIRSASR